MCAVVGGGLQFFYVEFIKKNLIRKERKKTENHYIISKHPKINIGLVLLEVLLKK